MPLAFLRHMNGKIGLPRGQISLSGRKMPSGKAGSQFWTKNPSGEAESQIPDRISKFAGGRGRFGQVWVVSLRTGFPNLGYDLLGRCQGS